MAADDTSARAAALSQPKPLRSGAAAAVSHGGEDAASEEMQIAWRYKNLPQVQSVVGRAGTPASAPATSLSRPAAGAGDAAVKFNCTFDLTRRMNLSDITPAPVQIDLQGAASAAGADNAGA